MNDPSDPSLEVLILLLSKEPLSDDALLNELIHLAQRYVNERFSSLGDDSVLGST